MLTRFGFTVRAALGNAVVRNRLKRRLRAAATSLAVKPGWDIVVNTRAGAQDAPYRELLAALKGLLEGAGVLESQAGS
jgi:ribonuclease P protein component